MTWRYGPFVVPLALSAIVNITMALTLWHRRKIPGARALIALLCATSWWALAELVQYGVQELPGKIFWTNMIYFGIVSASVFWFLFCVAYSRFRRRLRASELASLWIVPAVSLLLLWIDPTDGLMRRSVWLDASGPVVQMAKTYGPWFWVMVGYSYLLMGWGSVLLVRLLRRSGRALGMQALLLLAGVLCPWGANIVWLLGGYDWFSFDPTSIAFGVSGMLLAAGMRWGQLFDLMPAARDAAVASMRDGWLVVDTSDRLLDLNPAARQMLGGSDLVGRHLYNLAPQLSPMLTAQMPHHYRDQTVVLGTGDDARHYMAEESALIESSGERTGSIIILRDLTRHIRAQREREDLIAALQEALANVRELSGLLPICAGCKKIRDDQGYWTQLERYIAQHSRASFTHGLCPDCFDTTIRAAGLEEEQGPSDKKPYLRGKLRASTKD